MRLGDYINILDRFVFRCWSRRRVQRNPESIQMNNVIHMRTGRKKKQVDALAKSTIAQLQKDGAANEAFMQASRAVQNLECNVEHEIRRLYWAIHTREPELKDEDLRLELQLRVSKMLEEIPVKRTFCRND